MLERGGGGEGAGGRKESAVLDTTALCVWGGYRGLGMEGVIGSGVVSYPPFTSNTTRRGRCIYILWDFGICLEASFISLCVFAAGTVAPATPLSVQISPLTHVLFLFVFWVGGGGQPFILSHRKRRGEGNWALQKSTVMTVKLK